MAQFSPVASQSERFYNEITQDEKRGLFCIDGWEPDWNIGEGSGTNKAFLDFALIPCNMINTQYSDFDYPVGEECIPDLQSQIDYVGPIDLVIYANVNRFHPT